MKGGVRRDIFIPLFRRARRDIFAHSTLCQRQGMRLVLASPRGSQSIRVDSCADREPPLDSSGAWRRRQQKHEEGIRWHQKHEEGIRRHQKRQRRQKHDQGVTVCVCGGGRNMRGMRLWEHDSEAAGARGCGSRRLRRARTRPCTHLRRVRGSV